MTNKTSLDPRELIHHAAYVIFTVKMSIFLVETLSFLQLPLSFFDEDLQLKKY